MSTTRRGVSLQDLLAAHDGAGLRAHHVPEHAQSVREIVIVTDVDHILAVGPDSMVLLGEELALGGWVVSVALRYAWERRAVALVVSEQSFSDTVVELARRFGVGLFTASRGVDPTALALARELGALEAGALTRLDALDSRILRAENIPEVLTHLSQELGGALVELIVSGVSLHRAGQRSPEAEDVRMPVHPGSTGPELAASVPRHIRGFAGQALAHACPSVRALLLSQELNDLADAAPLLSFAALTGVRDGGAADAPAPPQEIDRWPPGTPLVAAVLRVTSGGEDRTKRIAPVVSSHWRKAFPRAPLARTQSGWFSFVPIRPSAPDVGSVVRTLAEATFHPLGVAVGVSVDAEGDERATSLLRRAWLAARLAEADGSVVDFHRMGPALVGRLLHVEDAREIADAAFPELLTDTHSGEIIPAVLAFLDCAGSMTSAADRLGVHRNTLQTRLRRARELGVRLNEPEQLLATHLIFEALDRAHVRTPSLPDH